MSDTEDESIAASDDESPHDTDLNSIDKLLGFLRAYQPTVKKKTRNTASSSQNKDPIPGIVKCLDNVKNLIDKFSSDLDELKKENVKLKQEISSMKSNGGRTYAEVMGGGSMTQQTPDENGSRGLPSSMATLGLDTVKRRLESLEQESYSKTIIMQGTAVQTLLNERISSSENSSASTPNNPQPPALKEKVSQVLTSIGDINSNQTDEMTVSVFGKEKKSVKIVFGSDAIKRKCIREIKVAKPDGIFASEFLTRTRADLLYQLRLIKKNNPGKLARAYSIDGSIYYKVEDRERGTQVRDNNDIEKLKKKLSEDSHVD